MSVARVKLKKKWPKSLFVVHKYEAPLDIEECKVVKSLKAVEDYLVGDLYSIDVAEYILVKKPFKVKLEVKVVR